MEQTKLQTEQMSNTTTMNTQLTARPNPFINSITVEISSPTDQHGIVRLIDGTGKIVRMLSWNLKRGLNITTLNNLKGLADGLYFLDVVDSEGNVMHKTKIVKE
jgi:tyrosinase